MLWFKNNEITLELILVANYFSLPPIYLDSLDSYTDKSWDRGVDRQHKKHRDGNYIFLNHLPVYCKLPLCVDLWWSARRWSVWSRGGGELCRSIRCEDVLLDLPESKPWPWWLWSTCGHGQWWTRFASQLYANTQTDSLLGEEDYFLWPGWFKTLHFLTPYSAPVTAILQ